MNQINIISITVKGEEAIKEHYMESLKIRGLNRTLFNKMYSQKIKFEPTYTLMLDIKLPTMQPHAETLLIEIRKALKDNGAEENVDYRIEVI